MTKIAFFNWKDPSHPSAGGAETVCWELCLRLSKKGYEVVLVTAMYPAALKYEVRDNIKIFRVGGNKYTHSIEALLFYLKEMRGKFDIIIECVNTVPYFLQFFLKSEKFYLFYHQLAKEVWHYETKFPMNFIGYYVLESVATFLQTLKKPKVITVSNSTRVDLVKHGFIDSKILIIREGITNKPLDKYDPKFKNPKFTILFHSSLRPMKRPEDTILAFSYFHKKYPDSQLYVSGGGDNFRYVQLCKNLGLQDSVKFFGRVTDEQKLLLMKESTFLCSTSVKEGWGLIVTEANSMGTLAITYDVDGLRDACTYGKGMICKEINPEALSKTLEQGYKLFHFTRLKYNKLCAETLELSRNINFDNCCLDFEKNIRV
jgi:glycosyltransferase involved in cell wall biosynthesis